MKLYDSQRAPNPRRVRWLMAEKGIADIEIVPMDILGGQHKQADYLSKAGLPNVPALELDDGTTITESIAICRYIEAKYPEPNFFGRTPEEAAVIEMWMRRAELLVANPLMMGVRHSHPALAVLEDQKPAIAEYNQAQGCKGLEILDQRLGESEWLGGARVSMADIVGIIGIEFARLIRFKPDAGLKNLERWMGAMQSRDAAKVAV
jgi:glutathione S-transferase